VSAEPIVSKGEFAQMIGVTNGRISQMIAAGQIGPEALEGTGQRAKIRVETAKAQLRRRLDIGQRMGNGLTTRLTPDAPPGPASEFSSFAPPSARSERSDLFEDAIRAERLKGLRLANRRATEEELERRGEFTATADVQAALSKVSADMVSIFEGALSDFAAAVSSKFQIPARDVLHLLRTEFRTVRSSAANALRAGQARLPSLVEFEHGVEGAPKRPEPEAD